MDCANAQYPPITGELREKLAEYKPTENGYRITTQSVGQTGYARLMELCDTIDAVHARLEAAYDRLRAEHASMAAALDRAEGEHEYAPESHYMMLPKDADGKPIHVGDVMEWIDPNGEFSLVCTVEAVSVDGFITWSTDCGRFTQKDAKAYHHYHKPTVEDVLTEFAAKLIERGGLTNGAAQTIAEYAAKLRLAGEK